MTTVWGITVGDEERMVLKLQVLVEGATSSLHQHGASKPNGTARSGRCHMAISVTSPQQC